jgi:hypothetical protein
MATYPAAAVGLPTTGTQALLEYCDKRAHAVMTEQPLGPDQQLSEPLDSGVIGVDNIGHWEKAFLTILDAYQEQSMYPSIPIQRVLEIIGQHRIFRIFVIVRQ